MKGFLFDENLPVNIQFSPSLPLKHVTDLGGSLSEYRNLGIRQAK
jgi:hypothetical protein